MSPANPPYPSRPERELHALTEVAKTLASHLELPDLLQAVMDKIIGVLEPADIGVVMLWDQPAGLFRPAAAFGYDMEVLKSIGLRAGESVTGKAYDHGSALIWSTPEQVAEAMADLREPNREIMARSIDTTALPICTIAAPIAVKDTKFGSLVLETIDGPAAFTDDDLPFVQTLADLIALAIDRARLEAKADAVRASQQADRMRAEVMALLSHQLRIPLTSIKGYSSALLLEEVEWDEEKRQEFLGYIEEESDNMDAMITEILDSSLIDVGQLHLERQPLRLQHLATEMATEMQRRTELHNLIVDFPTEFPLVEADPRWLKQVFRNVLDNAIKYSPQGGLIVIRGQVRSRDVTVSVADQGPGISPEDLIPLFEKYFRARTPDGVPVEGTGLGLPVARSIVEVHGGRIWAESKLGEGTTIYFSLPQTGI
jgi:K+-sensing histidine kinase KdpD